MIGVAPALLDDTQMAYIKLSALVHIIKQETFCRDAVCGGFYVLMVSWEGEIRHLLNYPVTLA